MAGFIDPHIHFPQMQVIGSYAGGAARVAEEIHLRRGAALRRAGACRSASPSRFFDELVRHGTTTAAAYCSVHPSSVDAFFAEAEKRNMLMVGGKVMMDRNAPPGLLRHAAIRL